MTDTNGGILLAIEPKLYDADGILASLNALQLKRRVRATVEAGIDLAVPAPSDLYVCRPYPNKKVLGLRSGSLNAMMGRKTGSGWAVESRPGVFLSFTVLWTINIGIGSKTIEQPVAVMVPHTLDTYCIAPRLRVDSRFEVDEFDDGMALQRWGEPSFFARFGPPLGEARPVSRAEWAASCKSPVIGEFRFKESPGT